MTWNLRYAAHFGCRSPTDTPLFHHSVGNADPYAHARYMTEIGFSGLQYTFALSRPPEEVDRFAAAMKEFQMESSCVLYTTLEAIETFGWGETGASARARILEQIRTACACASKLRAKTVAVIAMAAKDRPLDLQRQAMIANLKAAADIAKSHGVMLVVETMLSLPNMLLKSLADSAEVIRGVADPAVKILFDTHHAHAMGHDIERTYTEYYDDIGLLQLANFPVKKEAGAGVLDFTPVVVHAMRSGYSGLVELELHWSEPGIDGERAGLARMQALDAEAARIAALPKGQ